MPKLEMGTLTSPTIITEIDPILELAFPLTHPWVTIGCTLDIPELPGVFLHFGGQCGQAADIPDFIMDLITVLAILPILILSTILSPIIHIPGIIHGFTGLFTGIRDIMVILIGTTIITRTTITGTTILAEAVEIPEAAG